MVVSIPEGKRVIGYRDKSVDRSLNQRTDLISLTSGLCRGSPIAIAIYAVKDRKASVADDNGVRVGVCQVRERTYEVAERRGWSARQHRLYSNVGGKGK